jgi:hypothetical protein
MMVQEISGDLSRPLTFTFGPDREAKDMLLTELEKALYVFHDPLLGDENEIHRRTASVNALMATINFLRASGFREILLDPLKSLTTAVIDVTDGRSNPMLKRIEGGSNRSTKPLDVEMRAAQAVAYIDLMIEAKGLGVISSVLRDAAGALGITAETMTQKRKDTRSGRGISKVGQEHYTALMVDARSRKLEPKKLALFATQILHALHKPSRSS